MKLGEESGFVHKISFFAQLEKGLSEEEALRSTSGMLFRAKEREITRNRKK
ncbi:hypothetical protein KI387_026635, partial [Taxus chinensis]